MFLQTWGKLEKHIFKKNVDRDLVDITTRHFNNSKIVWGREKKQQQHCEERWQWQVEEAGGGWSRTLE